MEKEAVGNIQPMRSSSSNLLLIFIIIIAILAIVIVLAFLGYDYLKNNIEPNETEQNYSYVNETTPVNTPNITNPKNPITSRCGDGRCNGTETRINCPADCHDSSPGGSSGSNNPSCTPVCSGKQCGSDSCSGSCGTCGNGYECNSTGQCNQIPCINDIGCNAAGIFCNGSIPYNCSNTDADVCMERINLSECTSGYLCANSTGCYESRECTANYNCTYLNNLACNGDSVINNTGICSSFNCVTNSITLQDCNSLDNCYASERRDYFCSLSIGCSYNNITREENTANNNCNNGRDDDCDGPFDLSDSGCESCINDAGCSAAGSFCQGNMPYTCSLGSDGCLQIVNGSVCGTGFTCSSGSCVSGKVIYADNLLAADCTGTYSIADRSCSGSDGDAYNTIYESMQIARAGDLVLIRNGTYTEQSSYSNAVKYSGTAVSPITFKNFPGERFVIRGPYNHEGVSSRSPLYLSNVSNLIFDGFEISNHYIAISLANDDSNIWIRNVKVYDNRHGIYINGNSTNITIENGEAYRNSAYYDGGCGIGSRDSKNIVIKNFYSHNNNDLSGPDGDADGFCFSGGENVIFINCTSSYNSEDGFDLTALNLSLIDSRSFNNGVAGVKTWRRYVGQVLSNASYTLINVQSFNNGEAGIQAAQSPIISIFNSVVYNNGAQGIRLVASPGGYVGNGKAYNNIFAGNGFFTPVDNTSGYLSFSVEAGWNLSSDNNLYYNNYKNWTYVNDGPNSFSGDPMFVNAIENDFRLGEGSAAIDKGKDLSLIFKNDFLGNIRPAGDGWDIGPYEFNAGDVTSLNERDFNELHTSVNKENQSLLFKVWSFIKSFFT